jgi:hypothetical protein
VGDDVTLSDSNPSKWPVPETRLEIGLRKLRDYGGGAVLSDAEANAVLDEYDRTRETLRQADSFLADPDGANPVDSIRLAREVIREALRIAER